MLMQVTRVRRRSDRARRRLALRPRWTVVVGVATALALLSGTGIAAATTQFFGTLQVGQTSDRGLVVSDDQALKPIGDRLLFKGGEILASAVSPDGSHFAALTGAPGWLLPPASLVIFDLKTWKVQQLIGTNAADDLKINSSEVGQEGPAYSPDGKSLWMPQVDGYTKFTVKTDGSLAGPTAVSIPADGPRHALSAQAVFSDDGSTVYAAVNGQNRVVAIDVATGAIEQSWTVGIAPRDMVRVGDKIYVSNEGGRPARSGDTTLNSYNTQVPANLDTGNTTTGTVSVIDLGNPTAAPTSIDVGLHPTDLYAKGGTVFVSNTNSDTVSVIDTASNTVVQTIATQPWPAAKVGYEPDGIALTDDGHLLVTLGRANAVAVYRYTGPKDPASYVGLLPTDYFPDGITTSGNDVLVANTRGIDARGSDTRRSNGSKHITTDLTGTLQRFTMPNDQAIRAATAKVFQQNGWMNNSVDSVAGTSTAKPVAVPKRLGDPSTIKHVFWIIKENRVYDQQFGDIPGGNGDPALAEFGDDVTPNQHAIVKQFGLYDNTYDPATLSAEGHNWMTMSDNPEYSESEAGEYLRSYTTPNDALGRQRSGYIWTSAQAAGKTARVFNEFTGHLTKPRGSTWQDFYCDAQNMHRTGADTKLPTDSHQDIPSLDKITDHEVPSWDMTIPDIYREQMWEKDFTKNGPANLNIISLITDHMGNAPVNGPAQVADNDLAVGRMVDTISHSKYWKDSAIFITEDDTGGGLDHVDGHRDPIQIISPYAKHGAVDHHYYTSINMLRTIEQMLDMQPLNQKDGAATPMAAAFTDSPDFTPFDAVPNKTSLTAGLTPGSMPACGEDVVSSQANILATAPVPTDERGVADAWRNWMAHQVRIGNFSRPDSVNPQQLDHLSWYQRYGWTKPYPGEHKILAPNQVPGAYLPAAGDSDG